MQTSIEYTDLSGRIRIKNTPSFNHNTTLADVHQWISKWRKNPGNYYLVIKDPYEQYVDFDDEYIEDFKPFGTEESSSTTRGLVQLKIIEDNNHTETSSTGTTSVIPPPTETQSNHDNTVYDSIKASDPIKIDKNEPALEFTRNVHDIQRDQYMTDSTETNGKRNGNYVQLQGEKQDLQGHKKQASVKPHVKIRKAISCEERVAFTLLIYIVYELCEKGKRMLYHHNERQFLIKDQSNVNCPMQSMNQLEDNSRFKPVVLNNNNGIFNEKGFSLKLKTCVVIHSKTNHKVTRHLFCELTDRNSEQTNYATTRLACLLVKNNEILWDTLTLSNAMVFVKSNSQIGDISAIDLNEQIIEKIPVEIKKRKNTINQSDTVVKRPAVQKKQEQITVQAIQKLPLQYYPDQYQNPSQCPWSSNPDPHFMLNYPSQHSQIMQSEFTDSYFEQFDFNQSTNNSQLFNDK